jgi:hypothetical protein
VISLEGRSDTGGEITADGRCVADTQPPTGAEGGGPAILEYLSELVIPMLDSDTEPLPESGQPNLPAGALKKSRPDLSLKCADHLAHSPL